MKGQGPKLQGQENAPNIKTLTESKVTIKRKSAIIASIAMGRNRKLFCLYSSSSSSSQISCFPFNTTTGRLVKSCTDLVGQSTLETGIHENQKMKLVESNTEVLVDDISGKWLTVDISTGSKLSAKLPMDFWNYRHYKIITRKASSFKPINGCSQMFSDRFKFNILRVQLWSLILRFQDVFLFFCWNHHIDETPNVSPTKIPKLTRCFSLTLPFRWLNGN